MKRQLIIISLALIPFWSNGVSIQKLSIAPSDDAYVWTGTPSSNTQSGHKEIIAGQWTWSGFGEGTMRSYIKFSLQNLPSNARIIDAKLVLKAPNSTTSIQGGHQGNNSWRIEEVLGSWSESTITWNNKPSTSVDSVAYYFSETKSKSQNYETDITAMVMRWLKGSNNGLMLRLNDEKTFTSLIFASKEHPNSNFHPSLEIQYYVLQNNETFEFRRLTNQNDKDTYAWSVEPNMTNNERVELSASSWSWTGKEGIVRSFIGFQLLNKNVNVEKVWLRLYGIFPESSTVKDGHVGNNSGLVKRVVENWGAASLNWSNQPKSENTNSITTSPTSSKNEDFCIDITALYRKMMLEGNFGLLIELENETPFNSLMFGSIENPREEKRPAIEIVYKNWTTSTNDISVSNRINVFPNPANTFIHAPGISAGTFTIRDSKGAIVNSGKFTQNYISLNDLSDGLYFINIADGNNTQYFDKFLISR